MRRDFFFEIATFLYINFVLQFCTTIFILQFYTAYYEHTTWFIVTFILYLKIAALFQAVSFANRESGFTTFLLH